MMAIICEALGNRQLGYVFSTTQGEQMVSLGTKMTNAMVAAAKIPYISFHDIRRTISTGTEELGVPNWVISLTARHISVGIGNTLPTSGTSPATRNAQCLSAMGVVRWGMRRVKRIQC